MAHKLDAYVNAPLPIERDLARLFPDDAAITIFDIGACEGEDSVRYGRRFPHGAVYAVEALPKNVRLLRETLKHYRVRNVSVLPFALSDERGTATMFVSAGRPPGAPESDEWDYGNKSSSLLAPERHLDEVPWIQFDNSVEVQTRTLADVCQEAEIHRVDFLHIDVQGAELKVLDGAGELLRDVTAIWLEVEAVPLYHDQPLKDDVARYLRARGFELSKDTVGDVAGDQLWVRREPRSPVPVWTPPPPGPFSRIARLLGRGERPRRDRAARGQEASPARPAIEVGPETAPTVSVVLPVYNCPEYVGQAIESILGQTFGDFELIVIDDGSRDDTPTVLQRYTDPRITRVTQANAGLAATLNRGIGMARGRYIARQDQDDLSRPERLARQCQFLDANPECGLVGTWAEIWRGDTPTDMVHRHPADNAPLQFELLLNNPFVHSSVMLRRSALDVVGLYSTDPGRQPPEDFELWSRIARRFEVANIPAVLHTYREIEGSMSRTGPSPFRNHVVTICAENIAIAAGAEPTNRHAVNLAALVHGADDRIVGKLDFVAMRRLFVAAARHVSPEQPDRFVPGAAQRMDDLRRREWDRRYGPGWRRDVARASYALSSVIRTGGQGRAPR